MWGCDGVGSHWIVGSFLMVILLLLLCLEIYVSKGGARARYADRNDSIEILKLRLAKGEITHEAYGAMRKVLEEA